jgi:hypothetical protein
MSPEIVLRQPIWYRLVMLTLVITGAAGLLVSLHPLIGIGLAVIIGSGAVRLSLAEIRSSRDGIKLRGVLTTRVIPWSQVEGWIVASDHLAIVLQNQAIVPLDVTKKLSFSRRKRERELRLMLDKICSTCEDG